MSIILAACGRCDETDVKSGKIPLVIAPEWAEHSVSENVRGHGHAQKGQLPVRQPPAAQPCLPR